VGEDTRQIVDDIRAERNELGRNLHELEAQAKQLADWRTHYRNHPGTVLAVAFSGGVVLGVLAAGHGNGGQVASDSEGYHPPSSRPRNAGFNALRALGDNPRAKQQVGETWNEILETLIGLASAKAISAIGDFLPGFREQYDSRHTRPIR